MMTFEHHIQTSFISAQIRQDTGGLTSNEISSSSQNRQKSKELNAEFQNQNHLKIQEINIDKNPTNWIHVFQSAVVHVPGFYGLVLIVKGEFLWATLFYGFCLIWASMIGVTVGAHRLWTHRAFKAKVPLKILLILLNTLAAQGSAWLWVAVHRVHHKYSDTDKDPHDARRGLWYSHMGWFFDFNFKKFYKILRTIDMSDLNAEPMVMWQRKHYLVKVLVLSYCLPLIVPMVFWGETFKASFFIACSVRHLFILHFTFSVNSFAHLYGSKPYDKSILPSENKFVSYVAMGEGWHNFHHTFPWDYRTSELGSRFNPSTVFIDFFARIGWAYDLKTASQKVIEDREKRTGTGGREHISL